MNLVSTVIHILHTLTSICVKIVDFRCNVAVSALSNWRYDENVDYYAVNNGDESRGGWGGSIPGGGV